MNITDAEKEVVVGDKLEAIFARQKELMDKYHDIELRSGLLQTGDCPVNLDDKRGQARIKDFSWRVMEELGEAIDAYAEGNDDEEHFKEELIDGLHFLTELTILAGYDPEKLLNTQLKWVEEDVDTDEETTRWWAKYKESYLSMPDKLEAMVAISELVCDEFTYDERVMKFVRHFGMMCNCLKNKPWKQSNMITDKEAFYKRLSVSWLVYLSLLTIMNPDEITDTYLRKSQVNKFRQRSNY